MNSSLIDMNDIAWQTFPSSLHISEFLPKNMKSRNEGGLKKEKCGEFIL